MEKKPPMLLLLACGLIAAPALAQSGPVQKEASLYGAFGSLAVRDEYVSLLRYSGAVSTAGAEWGSRYADLWSHLALEYQRAASVENFNAQAAVTQLRVFYGHEYLLARVSLGGMAGEWSLGPAALVALHLRVQQVAARTFALSNYLSFFLDTSVALSSTFTLALDAAWSVRAAGSLGLAGVGVKSVDFSDPAAGSEREPAMRLLLPYSHLQGRGEVAVSRTLFPGCSASLAWLFQFQRTTAWAPLITAADSALLRVRYDW
jgi:hypothetical protein